MHHNNSTTETEDNPYFPFTIKQLQHFKKELQLAGGLRPLMMVREAMITNDQGMPEILKYHDAKGYCRKYLTGIYRSLWDMYDTDVPYTFWSEMYDALLKMEGVEDDE